MRPLIVITAGAAMAAAGYWWLKNSQRTLVPVAINSAPNQNTSIPVNSGSSPSYADLGFLDIF